MDIGRDKDENGRRWYQHDETSALSVTTIIGLALEEDTSGLERWQNDHRGQKDEFHHEHVFWFSGPRGTLAHYQALKRFADEDLWGPEEARSMQQLLEGPDDDAFDDASTDMDDVLYSILRYQGVVSSRAEFQALFSDLRLVDVADDDVGYFVEAFEEICDRLGVDEDSVIAVERYLLHDDPRFGGQTDLVYEDPNGDAVVVDLKTSSSLRQKHRLQAVAYKHGVEQAEWGPSEIDRVEVWRIDPDNEEWQIHSNVVPSHVSDLYDEERPDDSRYTDAFWFEDKWGDFSYSDMEDMWQTFKRLSEEAHRIAGS